MFEGQEAVSPSLNQVEVRPVSDNVLCDLYNQYLVLQEDLVNYKKNVLYHLSERETPLTDEELKEDQLRKRNVGLLDRVS